LTSRSGCASHAGMPQDFLNTLEATINARRGADPATSYTAQLFARGRAKIAQKVGEEAVETVIAALQDDRQELVAEATDLMFHLMVLLADAGLGLDDIRAEMMRREGVSGIDEKAARQL
jgi:phosphoribosyl-ATP pyrophosphohydrolase